LINNIENQERIFEITEKPDQFIGIFQHIAEEITEDKINVSRIYFEDVGQLLVDRYFKGLLLWLQCFTNRRTKNRILIFFGMTKDLFLLKVRDGDNIIRLFCHTIDILSQLNEVFRNSYD
jgi:hypothetical protein